MNRDTCLNTHLDAPLGNDVIHQAISDLKKPPTAHKGRNFTKRSKLSQSLSSLSHSSKISLNSVNFNPQIFLSFLLKSKPSLTANDSVFHLEKHLGVAHEMLKMESAQFLTEPFASALPSLLLNLRSSPHFQELRTLYRVREILEHGVCLSSKPLKHLRELELCKWSEWRTLSDPNSGSIGWYSDGIPGLRLALNPDFLLIQDYSGFVWIGTRDHFLMLSDVISQRWICLLASLLAPLFSKTNYPSWDNLMTIFEWGDQILIKYGNEGYRAIKFWEPLSVGYLLAAHQDPVCQPKKFLSLMLQDFQESLQSKFPGSSHDLFERSQDLIQLYDSFDNSHLVAQSFGLYRIWGHPSVNVVEGIKKLKRVACLKRTFNFHSIFNLVCQWRETFCLSYFAREKKWPKLEIINFEPSSYLLDCLKKNTPLQTSSPRYSKDDWSKIRFKQTFDIPEKFELSEMIADKATSLPKSQLIDHLLMKSSIGPADLRSVIMQWLKLNINDPEEFLRDIDENGFHPDETVIGVREKEREMSIEPRLFGLLPIRKRLYVVLTEALLADHILPYFPEITMTFDSITLMETIQQQTTKLKGLAPRKHSVIVNLDFAKWNSNMREEETAGIFRDFDNLFGLTNCFSRTHEMFKQSTLYAANGINLPEVDESGKDLKINHLAWTGHLGGIEGLRQKGWTIFTVCLLKYIADAHAVECEIMGQGDNQVLVLTYTHSDDQTFSDQHLTLMNHLEKVLESIGPPLKRDETWDSSNFFIYGKYPVLFGEPLSMSLKKICRTMRLTNDGLQNLSSTLSSISANCSAATSSDHDPFVPYFISMFESSGAFELQTIFPFYKNTALHFNVHGASMRIPIEGRSIKIKLPHNPTLCAKPGALTQLDLLSFLSVPSALGGYPIIKFWDLVVHGFPDPVTLNFQGVQSMMKHCDNLILRKRMNLILNPPLNPHKSMEMLCQDPLALNLLHGSSAPDKVKRMVFDFLCESGHKFIENSKFLEFLTLAKNTQTILSLIVTKMSPLHPKIASSIIESTVVGRAMQVMSKINKTNTLIKLMLKDREAAGRIFLQQDHEEYCNDDNFGGPPRISFFDLFGSFEQNYFYGVYYVLARNPDTMMGYCLDTPCSLERAEEYREMSWGVKLEGVSVAVPWELLSEHSSPSANCVVDHHPHSELGYFLTTILGSSEQKRRGRSTMGSYKVYFGSTTKNKVQYEGRKLAVVAPSILKNALKLLCLPGWGTPRDSDLSKLIYAIIQSMSDIPASHLVPSDSEIGGSVGHRWDDVKGNMTCTLSILWKAATFISSNTNHFHPELALSEVTTDNLKIHFQSIFLWSVFRNSLKISEDRQPLVSESLHYHINCKSCIRPLDETLISLHISQLEWDSLTVLTPNPGNPYCWVPSSALIGKQLFSENIAEPQDMPKDAEKVDLERALAMAVSRDLVKNHSLWENLNWKGSRLQDRKSRYVIPLSIILKLPPVLFVKELSKTIVLNICWILIGEIRDNDLLLNKWKKIVNQSFSELPASWFKPLIPYFMSPKYIQEMVVRWPVVSAPQGNPPSLSSKCQFFKSLCLQHTNAPDFWEVFSDWLTMEDVGFDIVSSGMMYHIVFKYALFGALTQLTSGSFRITLSHIRSVGCWDSESSYLNYSDISKIPAPASVSTAPVISLILQQFVNYIKRTQAIPKYYRVSSAGIASLLSQRVRPSTQNIMKTPGWEPSAIPTSRIFLLPDSFTGVTYSSESIKTPLSPSRSIVKNQLFTPGWPSSIGHFCKPLGGETTAPYKLLSVLHSLRSLLSRICGQEGALVALGDGSAGYSTLLGRIFIDHEILVNSLYELENIDAVGMDSPIPASLYNVTGMVGRVIGLPLLEEGLTDITQLPVIKAIARNVKKSVLIVCDAEGSGWANPEKGLKIAGNVSLLAYDTHCPLCIIKTYSANPGMVWAQLSIMFSYYENLKIIRSHFSSINNTEVFLIASSRRSEPLVIPAVQISPEGFEISNNCFPWRLSEVESNIRNDINYAQFAFQEADSYSKVLSNAKSSSAIMQKFEKLTAKWGNNPSEVLFPRDYFYWARVRYPLTKFSGVQPKTWLKTMLTKDVSINLVYEFLLLAGISMSTLATNISHKVEFEIFLTQAHVVFYLAISGEWAFYFNNTGDDQEFLSSKSYKVTELISKPLMKKLFTEIGQAHWCPKEVRISSIFKSPSSLFWGFSPKGIRLSSPFLDESARTKLIRNYTSSTGKVNLRPEFLPATKWMRPLWEKYVRRSLKESTHLHSQINVGIDTVNKMKAFWAHIRPQS